MAHEIQTQTTACAWRVTMKKVKWNSMSPSALMTIGIYPVAAQSEKAVKVVRSNIPLPEQQCPTMKWKIHKAILHLQLCHCRLQLNILVF